MFVNFCIKASVSCAFTSCDLISSQSATPEELRGALTPGRLDAERPALRRKLGSRILEATPVAYMSFLPDDYKRVAAEALVRAFLFFTSLLQRTLVQGSVIMGIGRVQ